MFLYILGFKHNQVPFFLQTLGLLAYSIDSSLFDVPRFLCFMRISYYQFGEQPHLRLVPENYAESSIGNFPYFTTDSNILRVAITLLLLAAVNCLLIIVFRLIYYLKEQPAIRRFACIRNLSDCSKKSIYRFLEFVYKTCMHPLLFFAVVNLSNWQAVLIVNSPRFHTFSLFLCAAIIVFYVGVTLWQCLSEMTAKLGKV